MALRFVLPVTLALCLAACASKPAGSNQPQPDARRPTPGEIAKPAPPAEAPPPPPAPPRSALVLHAQIVRASPKGGFVLLSFPVGTAPKAGQTMDVLRDGRRVARIRVSPLRRDDLFVAGILEGICQVGDQAVDR